MALSPNVTSITEKLITAKGDLRTSSKSAAACLSTMDDVGDCDIVNAAGVLHIHLGEHREKIAKAIHLIERANALMCDAHCCMKAQAESEGVDLNPISTFGGVRR